MSSVWGSCPLCGSDAVRHYASAHGRNYGICTVCRLVNLAPGQRLSASAELAEYRTHRNEPLDPGYRAFLNRVAAPLVSRLTPGAEGLDYGAGPGPTLSIMLEEQGFAVSIYDPFFAPHGDVLDRTYDFITCTETVEHFFEPGVEFNRLSAMLRPGGVLAVMTQTYSSKRPFEQWRYAREPTHVSFYHAATMRWLAEKYGWDLSNPGPGVFFFTRMGG